MYVLFESAYSYQAIDCVVFTFLFVVLGSTRKTRIIDVVYNASNNELVRTKTLVKNAIVVVDATPFRTWYESHYLLPLGRKKGAKLVRIFVFIISYKVQKSFFFNF